MEPHFGLDLALIKSTTLILYSDRLKWNPPSLATQLKALCHYISVFLVTEAG
jgi:hypothetical protein